MNKIDWSLAPEGATHYDTRIDVYPWLKADDNGNKFWHLDMWVNYANDIGVNDSIFARPEAKPLYTTKMQEAGEMPSVGMECLGKLVRLGENKGEGTVEFEPVLILLQCKTNCAVQSIKDKGLYYCSEFKPIDTRTGKQKDIDEALASWGSSSISMKDLLNDCYDNWKGSGNESK